MIRSYVTTPEMKKTMYRLYRDGFSYKSIGLVVGLHTKTVGYHIQRSGIKRRPKAPIGKKNDGVFEDTEAKLDVTSFSITIKRPNDTPWSCRGMICNSQMDVAFEPGPNKNAAKEAAKQLLWYAFEKAYQKKE